MARQAGGLTPTTTFVRPAQSTGLDHRSVALIGVGWAVLAGILLTSIGAVAKLLGDEVHVFQLTLARAVFGLALIVPAGLARHGTAVFDSAHLRLHAGRGLASTVGIAAAFYAAVNLPLPTVTAIGFAAPLFVTILARVVLGESVSAVRWISVTVGLVGVAIIARPSGRVGVAALVAVFGAGAVAAAKLFVKELAAQDGHETILIYLCAAMTVLAAGPAVVLGRPLNAGHLAPMALIGILSIAAQSCVIRAYKTAKASAVAPAEYCRLLFASGFSVVLFSQPPRSSSIVGAAILIGGTVVSAIWGEPRSPA